VSEPCVGTEITKNVKLVRVLSRGGAGTIWVGHHQMLDMLVAVKLISRTIMSSEARARFTREALVAAQLKSAHVVRMFDHGTTPDGHPFIVMELCSGEDLGCRLRRSGQLSPAETRRIVKQLASALSEAHARGFVHRDIKPGNIFLEYGDDGQPFVRLLDFGLAKQLDGSALLRTATGIVLGTPSYMSPEQAFDASRSDHQADLWAVAAVAYHCLTGQRPFRAESYGGLCVALSRGQFPPPSVIRPELGGSFDAFFSRAFQPDVRLRYQSARELRDGLLYGEKRPSQVPNAPSRWPWFVVLACVALGAMLSLGTIGVAVLRPGWPSLIVQTTQAWLTP